MYREGKWVSLSSDLLVPGDIISLPRPKSDAQVVPCDALLLRGECVVNESLLTGESVPQIKESLVSLAASASLAELQTTALSLTDRHKNYVICGGTQLLLASYKAMHSNTSSSTSTSSVAEEKSDGGVEDKHDSTATLAVSKIKTPPDNGCICFVLRTGFDTTQGKLLRTILFSTERVTVNNVEALLFIGVLLVFALVASAFVFLKGLVRVCVPT